MGSIGKILMVVVPILMIVIFGFTFVMILSPKLRGKWMAKQLEATKYMMEASKGTMKDIAKTTSEVQHDIIEENKDLMKETADMQAEIHKDAIKTTAKAIKDGLKDEK